MYVVTKEVGARTNIYLTNTNTQATFCLGTITPTILQILRDDGYRIDETAHEDAISLIEKWYLKLNNDDTKNKLIQASAPFNSKPKTKKEDKKPIVDVLDIIYGINS